VDDNYLTHSLEVRFKIGVKKGKTKKRKEKCFCGVGKTVLCNFVHAHVGCRKTSSKMHWMFGWGGGRFNIPLFVTLWMSDWRRDEVRVIYNMHKCENCINSYYSKP
jgi:hypothetical protein